MKRLITALVLVLIGIALILYQPFYLSIIFCLLAIIAEVEMSDCLQKTGGKPFRVLLTFYPPLTFIAILGNGLPLFLVLIALMMVAALFVRILYPSVSLASAQNTTFLLLYPAIPMLAMACVSILIKEAYVKSILVIWIGSTSVGDAAAMYGGMLFGKRKLCPQISPNKTIAGLIIQLIFAPLASLAFYALSSAMFMQSISILHALAIGVICAIFAPVGDLIASSFKRSAGIKDFGTIIPGHGGVLDRFDALSMTALFTLIYLFLSGFGK